MTSASSLRSRAAAAVACAEIDISPGDLQSVADHLALLLVMVDDIREVEAEPAPVFQP